ncbi:hypothetical protein B7494_g536 [Chlorociboria aeruginascens]|nr:hypothetical protein B7494_g536 [Chlorociboria aeruginascens]
MRQSTLFFSLFVVFWAVEAGFVINNMCTQPVYYYISTGGGCDMGSTGVCNENPYTVTPNGNSPQAWHTGDGGGPSIKLALDPNASPQSGILQFEYTWTAPMSLVFYDFSDINGHPFEAYNNRVVPTGDRGNDTKACAMIPCKSGSPCTAAYQNPDDNESTHSCPIDTGTMNVDLCVPDAQFSMTIEPPSKRGLIRAKFRA